MKVQIKNFQSIQNALIDIDGLTTLTGESSNGKSAVLRAIRALLQNPSGTHCIHKGTLECNVVLENEGHKAEWVKTNTQTLYRIDGEEFTKLNRAVPEQIESLGFGEIVAGKEVFYPQIFRQFDKPFILSEASPSVIAELLASSRESQQIARANKIAQDELRQRSSEVKVIESQVKGQVASLKVLGECSRFLLEYNRRAISSEETYSVSKSKFGVLSSLLSRWKKAQQILEVTKISVQCPTGVLDDGRVQTVASIWSRFRKNTMVQRVSIPKLETTECQDLSARYESIKGVFNRLRLYSSKATIQLPDISSLELDSAIQKFSKLNLTRLAQRKALRDRDTSMVELAQVGDDIKVNERENSQMLKTLGYCPVCNTRKTS